MDKFNKLGSAEGMYTEQLTLDVRNFLGKPFQYVQITNLVNYLQKSYNVFCLLTSFEQLVMAGLSKKITFQDPSDIIIYFQRME